VTALEQRAPRPAAEPRPFPHDHLSDEQLVVAASRGEQRAWEVLWDRHSPSVKRVLRSCLGADSALDDLVQETFMALHRALYQLEKPEAPRNYLLGAASRLAAMEIRGRSRRFRWLRLTPDGELPEPPHVDHTDPRSAVKSLDRVLSTLSADLRVAFVLRYVEGMSPPEVAQALSVSESTAKRQVAKARDLVLKLAERDPGLSAYVQAAAGGEK
jgi:RNA polymerase sigma factor (sigma-70 family)